MHKFSYVTSPSIDPSVGDKIDELEDQLAEMIREMSDDSSYHQAKSDLAVLEKALTEKDVNLDEPLKLSDAVCLSELGGHFTADPESRLTSETITVKTLRSAIAAGQLSVIRPNSKNMYVTRRAIKDWVERCHVRENPHTSSLGANAATKREPSLTKQSTSSKMETSNTALDAALESLRKLRSS
jgi:hypothetical protein